MRKCNAADKAGVSVEISQHGSDKLLEIIAELFNSLLFDISEPPDVLKIWEAAFG